jgi:hypothetical protein
MKKHICKIVVAAANVAMLAAVVGAGTKWT